MTEWL